MDKIEPFSLPLDHLSLSTLIENTYFKMLAKLSLLLASQGSLDSFPRSIEKTASAEHSLHPMGADLAGSLFSLRL